MLKLYVNSYYFGEFSSRQKMLEYLDDTIILEGDYDAYRLGDSFFLTTENSEDTRNVKNLGEQKMYEIVNEKS